MAFASTADLTGANPDGNSEIFLHDGSDFLQITDTLPGGGATTGRSNFDGASVALTSTANLSGTNPDMGGELFLYDGVEIAQITDIDLGRFIRDPSLEGGAIAFISNALIPGGGPAPTIEVYLYDGSGFHRITEATAGFVSLQPSLNGGAIAFASNADLTGDNPDGNLELFLATRGASVLEIPALSASGLALLGLLLCGVALATIRRFG